MVGEKEEKEAGTNTYVTATASMRPQATAHHVQQERKVKEEVRPLRSEEGGTHEKTPGVQWVSNGSRNRAVHSRLTCRQTTSSEGSREPEN